MELCNEMQRWILRSVDVSTHPCVYGNSSITQMIAAGNAGTHLNGAIDCLVDQETHRTHEVPDNDEVAPALPNSDKNGTGASATEADKRLR